MRLVASSAGALLEAARVAAVCRSGAAMAASARPNASRADDSGVVTSPNGFPQGGVRIPLPMARSKQGAYRVLLIPVDPGFGP